MNSKQEYEIYTDESFHKLGSETVGIITAIFGKTSELDEVNSILGLINKKYSTSEVKYHKIRSEPLIHKEYFDTIIPLVGKKIFVYGICRNTLDSRYDEKFNQSQDYDIMYYHLIKNIARKKIPIGSKISCYPDEKNDSKRKDILYYLNNTRYLKKEIVIELLYKNNFLFKSHIKQENIFNKISIENIFPSQSHEKPLLQCSDLLSGIVGLSNTQSDDFFQWRGAKKHSMGLFAETLKIDKLDISNRSSFKFKLLDHFDLKCKENKLQVSLETHKKIFCHKDNGFYIHYYESQGPYDKAPALIK